MSHYAEDPVYHHKDGKKDSDTTISIISERDTRVIKF